MKSYYTGYNKALDEVEKMIDEEKLICNNDCCKNRLSIIKLQLKELREKEK